MIYFYLPGFTNVELNTLNLYFIKLLKEHPKYFYNDIAIGAVYGAFPNTIWNGGRSLIGYVTFDEICQIIDVFDEYNIPIRFTYTNCLIEEQHLLDKYSNIITELAHTGKNEILVNSPVLEEYLRNTYPNYKYISSTTKCLMNLEDVINESNKYYLTVLDYRKNNDIDFLSQLENPEKFEILLNAYCDPNCPQREKHYIALSKIQLNESKENIECSIKKTSFFEALNLPTVIKLEELYNIYKPCGFKHFKIEGRTDHIIDVLESYLYYMIKPQYCDEVRYLALKKIININ